LEKKLIDKRTRSRTSKHRSTRRKAISSSFKARRRLLSVRARQRRRKRLRPSMSLMPTPLRQRSHPCPVHPEAPCTLCVRFVRRSTAEGVGVLLALSAMSHSSTPSLVCWAETKLQSWLGRVTLQRHGCRAAYKWAAHAFIGRQKGACKPPRAYYPSSYRRVNVT